jgi:hypothetical protein
MSISTEPFEAKWTHKIRAATDYFKKWEQKFDCQKLDKYYEGFQNTLAEQGLDTYTLNLFESTFAIKKPNVMFKQPIFYVEPRPGAADTLPEAAMDFATNAEDLLNTIALDPRTELAESLEMAILDAGSYFGVIEVSFGLKSQPNPVAGDIDEFGEKEPNDIVSDEWMHVKRIPAHRFRVGGNDCATFEKADWCGYYEYMRTKDLTAKNGFKNIDQVDYPGTRTDEFITEYSEDDNHITTKGDIMLVWRIWDNIEKMAYIMTEKGVILYEEEFDRLPLFDLRFKRRRKGWYPIPFFYNWKSPQDEINESREQLRAARRRAKRMWTITEGQISNDELDKLTSGPDGTVVFTRDNAQLNPVQYPPLDASIGTVLQVSKDDFNIVSGTSAEARGQSDRTTATQASIIDSRARIRDNEERELVAQWICKIGREILKQVRENFTLPMAVKSFHDLGGFFKDIPEIEYQWKMIQAEDIGVYDYSVTLSVESISPVANDQTKKNFMEFVALISQYPIISSHPVLIKEAAFRTDYHNNKVIKAFQEAAAIQLVGRMGGMPGEEQGNPSDNMAQQTTQQMQPPTQTEIQNQMDATGVPQ